ncbi:MAG: hypothetical protein ACOX2G_01605 [Bacillota bacterium]|jgi:hypothetical protein
MRRKQRDIDKIEMLRLLDAFARNRGWSITDSVNKSELVEALTHIISQRPQENLVHGLRVESMFAYVVGAIGACRIIKQEDAGDLFSKYPEFIVPDFYLVTSSGEEYLIEVKNCHRANITDFEYRLTARYYNQISAYADARGLDLKIAIYWSRLQIWTLLPINAFEKKGNYFSLPMEQCVKRDEMSLLGDVIIATVPPLELRILFDQKNQKTIEASSKIMATCSGIELWCGGRRVTDPYENKLAWFLLLFGHWPANKPEYKFSNGKLISINFMVSQKKSAGHNFAVIGRLSEMISRQYNELTAPDGQIKKISPSQDPDDLGIMIPADYMGEIVHLWRFELKPNYD